MALTIWMTTDHLAFIVISFILGLYIAGELISHKVVIDKSTESITVKKGYFLLLPRQLVISFSDVVDVEIVQADRYNPSRFSHFEDAYEVCINYHGENYRQYVKIEKTTSERDMLNLAEDIRWIIAK